MSRSLLALLAHRADSRGIHLARPLPDAVDVIRVVKAIPYARAANRAPTTIVEEWRGTCSGKHYLLAATLSELNVPVRLIHRVYRLARSDAQKLFPHAASAVPADGLTDVHTYTRILLEGRETVIDVTFAGEWDGRSDMPLACGAGLDVAVALGADPQEVKDRLVRQHCTPAEREPFIAALSL